MESDAVCGSLWLVCFKVLPGNDVVSADSCEDGAHQVSSVPEPQRHQNWPDNAQDQGEHFSAIPFVSFCQAVVMVVVFS